jgi:hypothetical protein
MTLQMLSREATNCGDSAESAYLNVGNDAAFVIYCSDFPASHTSGAREFGAGGDSFGLSRIPDISSQGADGLSGTARGLRSYERAAHLALRFVRSTVPVDDSIEKRYSDIHELLWRLFVSAQESGSDPDSIAVGADWLTVANGDSATFDFSKWRF